MQLCEQLFCSVPNCGCRGVLNHCIRQVPGGKGSLSGLTLNTSTTETFTYTNQQPATRCSPEILFRWLDGYARSGPVPETFKYDPVSWSTKARLLVIWVSGGGGPRLGNSVGSSGSLAELSWSCRRAARSCCSGLLTLVALFGGVVALRE